MSKAEHCFGGFLILGDILEKSTVEAKTGHLCGRATGSGLAGPFCGAACQGIIRGEADWGRAEQRINGTYQNFCCGESCPSSPLLETRQFNSSLYVSVTFSATVLSLEFRASVYDQVSLCSGTFRGCLCLQQLSNSPGWNPCWCSGLGSRVWLGTSNQDIFLDS